MVLIHHPERPEDGTADVPEAAVEYWVTQKGYIEGEAPAVKADAKKAATPAAGNGGQA